jgi:hypothetical protein
VPAPQPYGGTVLGDQSLTRDQGKRPKRNNIRSLSRLIAHSVIFNSCSTLDGHSARGLAATVAGQRTKIRQTRRCCAEPTQVTSHKTSQRKTGISRLFVPKSLGAS